MLQQRGLETAEVDAKERTLERLRRRVALERSVHLFVEVNVQRAVQALPAHEPVRRRLPDPSPRRHGRGAALAPRASSGRLPVRPHRIAARERTTLVGFLVYATAPPRLSGLGIVDTVSGRQVDLHPGLASSLYNPYAAVPSMHVGYALIVAAGLVRHGGRLLVRAIRALYPPFVVLVIVATGNHFFLDAAADALVAGSPPRSRPS